MARKYRRYCRKILSIKMPQNSGCNYNRSYWRYPDSLVIDPLNLQPPLARKCRDWNALELAHNRTETLAVNKSATYKFQSNDNFKVSTFYRTMISATLLKHTRVQNFPGRPPLSSSPPAVHHTPKQRPPKEKGLSMGGSSGSFAHGQPFWRGIQI